MEGAITPGSTMATNRMVRKAALLSRACGVDFHVHRFRNGGLEAGLEASAPEISKRGKPGTRRYVLDWLFWCSWPSPKAAGAYMGLLDGIRGSSGTKGQNGGI